MAGEDEMQISLLAAEYVLGTLEAPEIGRFEALLEEDAVARRELAYWEQRLSTLALALEPVEPPAEVWDRIAAILAERENTPPSTPPTARPGRRAPRVGLWRGLAIAASVAALALAALLFAGVNVRPGQPSATGAPPAYASMVYDKATGTSWLVTASAGSDKMAVMALGNYDVPKGKILRAWFKPDNGQPILIGRWPHTGGKHTMTLPTTVAQAMNQPAELVVSMEDSRYAGTPSPHGKVMWAVPIARRSG